MSRARHHTHKKEHEKHREAGGATETGGNPHVFALANEKRSIGHIGGEKAKPRLDRKRGGACRASGGSAANPYSEGKQPSKDRKRGGHVEDHEKHHIGLHGAHKKGHPEHHKHEAMHEMHHPITRAFGARPI